MTTYNESSSEAPALPALGILATLSEPERAELASHGRFLDHHKGDKLVEQGQPQGYLHLLMEGELRAVAATEGLLLTLGYVHPGECVGEMALLEPVKSAFANVIAQSSAKVWAIQRDDFDEFLKQNPAAGAKILREIAVLISQRLRRMTEHAARAEQ